jgi:NADH:ubiquinone reductase (H+-translocating)
VVALGAVTRTFPIPGLAEHGRGFKDVADAVALRNHLLRSLESFPPKLGDYTHRYLEREGIEIHVETTLTSFDELEAVLSDGTRIPARTLVWAAGVRPSPDLALLGLPLDERGRVTVDPTLQAAGTRDVWALGDCAAAPNAKTPGRFDPPTCQHALRQAQRLAKNLTATPSRTATGCSARSRRSVAIAALPSCRACSCGGFPGWFVARTYHLYALPTIRRKIRVVADWTVALFFRRDIVELSALTRPHELGP